MAFNPVDFLKNLVPDDANMFGASPNANMKKMAEMGLLGDANYEDMLAKANKQSVFQGLLNTGLAYAAQPKNQGYGSIFPYLAKSGLAGVQAAQSPFDRMGKDAMMNQQLKEQQRVLGERTKTQDVINKMIENDPSLEYLNGAPLDQQTTAINEKIKLQMSPSKVTAPKRVKRDMVNDNGTPNIATDDYLDVVVEEFDPTLKNSNGVKGDFREISRSPKVMESEALFSDNAANLYAEQYLLTGVFPPFGRGKHAAANRAKVTDIAAGGAVRKGFVKNDPETGSILLDKKGQPVPDFESFTADIQVNKAMIRDQSLSSNRFSTGKQGDTIRSLNVGIDHLETFREFAEALHNKDVKDINRLRNKLAIRLSNEDLAAFEVTKTIVSTEIAKAITGSNVMTYDDRSAFGKQVSAAQSYDEIVAAITAAQKLMAGQLEGLEQQYISSTSPQYRAKNPFFISRSSDGVDGFVGKRTEEVLNRVRGIVPNEGIENPVNPDVISLSNPRPEDATWVKLYKDNPNSPTGRTIKQKLLKLGYNLNE